MAAEVPAREVAATGDWGFSGSGGGARSGSELSHLLLFSFRQRVDMASTSCLREQSDEREREEEGLSLNLHGH